MSKFTTKFSAIARAIPPTEDIKKEAFASLKDLEKLLPDGIKPEDDKDLLYICANLVAFPCSNANGDAIDRATALKICKGFIKKFLDVEHNRNVVVGNIFNSGFTTFESNDIVDEDTVFNSDGLYNIAITGYLWRVIAGKLADFLIQASNENNKEFGAVSLSFEVGFDDYDIVVGSKILKDAQIITDTIEKQKYEKYLQANEGKGVDEDGNYVYRLLKDVIPLGAGLVTRPASQVKGILALASETQADSEFTFDKPEEKKEEVKKTNQFKVPLVVSEQLRNIKPTKDGFYQVDLKLSDGEIIKNVKIHSGDVGESDKNFDFSKIIGVNIENDTKSSVNTNTKTNMSLEITTLTDIETKKADLFKDEAFAGKVTRFIADEIAAKSEIFSKQLKEKADLLTTVQANKAEVEAKTADLENKLNQLTSEYNKLSEETNKAHKAARLENRMASIKKDYDLDEAGYATIAKDIEDMTDDEHSCYMKKMEPFIKDKAKSAKSEKTMKVKDALKLLGVDTDKIQDKDSLEKEISSAKELASAFASIKEVEGGKLPNGPTLDDKSTLKEKMKNAFGKSVKLNSKELISKK
jgi:hypothetical protein